VQDYALTLKARFTASLSCSTVVVALAQGSGADGGSVIVVPLRVPAALARNKRGVLSNELSVVHHAVK
jgi:hypothetical protein